MQTKLTYTHARNIFIKNDWKPFYSIIFLMAKFKNNSKEFKMGFFGCSPNLKRAMHVRLPADNQTSFALQSADGHVPSKAGLVHRLPADRHIV